MNPVEDFINEELKNLKINLDRFEVGENWQDMVDAVAHLGHAVKALASAVYSTKVVDMEVKNAD